MIDLATFEVERRHVWSEESGHLSDDVDRIGDPDGASVRVGHLSDLHYGKPVEGPEVPERLEQWLGCFERHGVDLVVLSGDLVEEPGDRAGMLRIRRLLERADPRWVVVPGNHDIAEPGGRAPFHDLFGDYPRVARVAGVECVLFDSMTGLPVDERTPFEHLDAQKTGCYARGRVGGEALRRAEGRLAETGTAARILVVHHHLAPLEAMPIEPSESGAPDTLMVPALDADRVGTWARRHGVDAVFHGHQHTFWPPYGPAETSGRGPVVLNSGSSTRGKPRCRARLVDLDDETVVWELVASFTGAEA